MRDSRVYKLFELDLSFYLVVKDRLRNVYELDDNVLMVVAQEFILLYLYESVRAHFECVVVILPKGLLVAVDIRLIEDYENLVLKLHVVLR